ncbi:LysR family transcriptional regulator [Roseomonas marmotae]|uniref:LysR family transcriptional regulator n=1 Tax=Roseomonas marmotae TaxID=2768161 RepID=A0ABS3K9W4_9PROT|nr:LysR family transcriptional regulator [Roseomonas marmotae]MBO1074251.1 LysR family transcriptional regulator [Roseomonas marmotae]QTI78005.1 LysR family transcriptional regulator [Roseomonas marmotae]
MRLDADDLATFVQVVDCGTLTAAALRLGLAKSVVSKRVAALEAQLGVRLLHRAPRRMTATEAGALLHARARTLLAQLDSLAEDISAQAGTLRGSIRMAGPMSFGTRCLGPAISSFMCRYEQIEISLDLDDRHVDLLAGGYDLAVRIGRLGDSSLRSRRLGTSHRVLCCSAGYAERVGLPQSLEDLSTHACLGYANVPSGHIWRFMPKGGGEHRSVVVRGRLTVNTGEALLDAARAGLGLTMLPSFMVGQEVAAGQLMPVSLPGWVPVPDIIHVVYPETPMLPLKLRALIEHLAGAITEPFPWDTALALQALPPRPPKR